MGGKEWWTETAWEDSLMVEGIDISWNIVLVWNLWLYVTVELFMLKRREESDTYLTHICRHHSSGDSLEKRLNMRDFQPALWFSSAVEVDWPIELYCINGVVIAAQCTATFLRSIVLPRIWVLGREYAD